MLKISQGDTVVFQFTAKNGMGVPVNLTGASFVTEIRGPANVVRTFPNGQHTANPDQTLHTGEFTLALSDADTLSLALGRDQEIVTKITIGGSIVFFHGFNILTVLQNVPLPIL